MILPSSHSLSPVTSIIASKSLTRLVQPPSSPSLFSLAMRPSPNPWRRQSQRLKSNAVARQKPPPLDSTNDPDPVSVANHLRSARLSESQADRSSSNSISVQAKQNEYLEEVGESSTNFRQQQQQPVGPGSGPGSGTTDPTIVIPTPSSSYLAKSLQPSTRLDIEKTPRTKPPLIVLDLNKALIARPPRENTNKHVSRTQFQPRPYLSTFLAYLCSKEEDVVSIDNMMKNGGEKSMEENNNNNNRFCFAVWSSATRKNVSIIAEKLGLINESNFSPTPHHSYHHSRSPYQSQYRRNPSSSSFSQQQQTSHPHSHPNHNPHWNDRNSNGPNIRPVPPSTNFIGVWCREDLGLSQSAFFQKVETTKDLDKLWDRAVFGSSNGGDDSVGGGTGSGNSSGSGGGSGKSGGKKKMKRKDKRALLAKKWSQEDSLLIDDEPAKCKLHPFNHLPVAPFIWTTPSPSSFSGSPPPISDDTNLLSLIGLLERIRLESNFSNFIRDGGLEKVGEEYYRGSFGKDGGDGDVDVEMNVEMEMEIDGREEEEEGSMMYVGGHLVPGGGGGGTQEGKKNKKRSKSKSRNEIRKSTTKTTTTATTTTTSSSGNQENSSSKDISTILEEEGKKICSRLGIRLQKEWDPNWFVNM